MIERDEPVDATQQYLHGQMRPSQPALLAAFEQESAASVAACRPELDIPYGAHPRQVFDLYRTGEQRRGTMLYFHAGYWQSRDKSSFRFLAPHFTARGIDLALVNYPLCPEVTVRELVEAARQAVPAVREKVAGALVLAGHSAGGQIIVELALTALEQGREDVAGIVALSGVFDLRPLIETPLNDKLRLDVAEAEAMSPLARLRRGLPPAVFAVGALETEAFRDQTAQAEAAWSSLGSPASMLVVEDADHFSILRQFVAPGSPLNSATLSLFPAGG